MKQFIVDTVAYNRISGILARFRSESKGVAAVEFALIAPILIMLFIGTLEISLAIAVDRKVSRISSTVADLVTQSRSLTQTEIDDIMDVAARVMYPYENEVGIRIVGVQIEGGSGEVVWSRARNASAATTGSGFNVPNSISQDGTFLIVAEITAEHTPVVGLFSYSHGFLTKDVSPFSISETMYLRPRIGAQVTVD